MIECNRAQGLIGLYATGHLSPDEAHGLALHITGCATCQNEFVQEMRLSWEVRRAFAALPAAPAGVWEKVAARRQGVQLARLDLGSLLLGLSLMLTAHGRRLPVRGELQILGRRLRLFET